MFLIVNLRGAHLWILSFEAWNSNTRGLHQSPGIFSLWWSQCLFVLFQSRKLHGTGTASASWSVWLFLSSPSHPVHCVSSSSLTRNRPTGAGASAKLGLRPVALGVFFFSAETVPFRTTPWLVLLPRSSARRNGSTFVAPPLLVLSCIAFVRRCFVLLRFRRTCCVLRCALSAVLPPSTASANLEAGLEEDAPPSSTQAPFPLASSRSDIVEVRDPRCARSAARPIEVNFVRVYEPGQGRTLSPSPGTSREFLLEEGREGGPPTACLGRARDGAHPRAS